jgi:hypothetical protein
VTTGEPIAKCETAREFLARQLHWKTEHLDPSDEREWDSLPEHRKEFFRALVSWLLVHPNEIQDALNAGPNPPQSS